MGGKLQLGDPTVGEEKNSENIFLGLCNIVEENLNWNALKMIETSDDKNSTFL